MEVIENGGEVRINTICTLKRWTEAAGGRKVDELEARFKVMGVKVEKRVKIADRDYDGVIKSVELAMAEFFGTVTDRLCKNLEAGYR